MSIESGGWFSRRAAHLMIFAGVFERHPALTLVLTEQPGQWWPYLEQELDSVHLANASRVRWRARCRAGPASTCTATSSSERRSFRGTRRTGRCGTATPTA